MSVGIRISKETFDVKEAEKKDLIYDSDLNAFKVWKEGSGTGVGTIKIDHELSFTPTFLAYAELETDKMFQINFDGYLGSVDNPYGIYFWGYTDAKELTLNIGTSYFVMTGNSQDIGRNYYYYIFGDTAKEADTKSEFSEEFGIKVSKLYKEASSNFIEDLLLTSEKPPLKLYKQGEVTVEIPTMGGDTVYIEHDLPFIPAFTVLARKPTDDGWKPIPQKVDLGRNLYAYSTPKHLVLYVASGFDVGTYMFKYLIFASRARA